VAKSKLVGSNYTTPDMLAKVTGRAKYAEDFRADGMLFAKLLLSPMPHARISRIDASAALAMPGVHAVITADDLPATALGGAKRRGDGDADVASDVAWVVMVTCRGDVEVEEVVVEVAEVEGEVMIKGEDDVRWAVNISGFGNDLRLLSAVVHVVEPDAGFLESLEDSSHGFRIFVGEFREEGADFFGMIFPDVLCVQAGEANAVEDSASVPWFADAIAIHLSNFHVGDHLRRRNGDERNVFVRVNTAGAEKIAHPHGVRAEWKGHGEGHRFAFGFGRIDQGLQRFGIVFHFPLETGLKGDRLAVPVQHPWDDHWLFR